MVFYLELKKIKSLFGVLFYTQLTKHDTFSLFFHVKYA